MLARAGAQVVACARRLDRIEELSRTEPGIIAVRCDVADAAQRETLLTQAMALTGSVDILVNNAGIGSDGKLEQTQLESLQRVLAVNVEAVFSLSQMVGAHMLERESGTVINISSMFGQVAATPIADAPYVTSKSALNGLTRELANQWAPHGVRVNAVAPGWFVTEMNSELLESEGGVNFLSRQCPMRRAGREHELDGILLFLASDASTYCTGQIIAVDGGWTIR